MIAARLSVRQGPEGERLLRFDVNLGALADGEVPEGLRHVGFPDADGAVQDDRFPAVEPSENGEVTDLRGGQLGLAAKSKPSRVACSSKWARRGRRCMDMVSRRVISSWHSTWRKSKWPSSPAWSST